MLFQDDAQTIRQVTLGDEPLTLPQFIAVCRFDAKVIFSESYRQRVTKSRQALEAVCREKFPFTG